ncbi:V-set and immunoglobulin domain containing protein 1 [Dissostichus eleginoides]|nr:V-set and immunoglobulin domain containing protein 1 [Dissostichus eleginoides]
MAELKRIKMSSLLILLLQFTGTAIGQRSHSLSVRVGDEATLTCNYVIHDQDKCDGTTWIFSDSGSTVILVKGGQIGNHAKSDRLRVTEKCSLVIKKVTEEDAGQYTCRQIRPGQQGPDSWVDVSVVTSKRCSTHNNHCHCHQTEEDSRTETSDGGKH